MALISSKTIILLNKTKVSHSLDGRNKMHYNQLQNIIQEYSIIRVKYTSHPSLSLLLVWIELNRLFLVQLR